MLGPGDRRLYTTASSEHRLGPLPPGSTGLVQASVELASSYKSHLGSFGYKCNGGRKMDRW